MRRLNGTKYYTTGDVAIFVRKSRQTVVAWDELSRIYEQRYGKRLIPIPIKNNGQRLYKKEEVQEIIRFSKDLKRGFLAKVKKELGASEKGSTRKVTEQMWAVEENQK